MVYWRSFVITITQIKWEPQWTFKFGTLSRYYNHAPIITTGDICLQFGELYRVDSCNKTLFLPIWITFMFVRVLFCISVVPLYKYPVWIVYSSSVPNLFRESASLIPKMVVWLELISFHKWRMTRLHGEFIWLYMKLASWQSTCRLSMAFCGNCEFLK